MARRVKGVDVLQVVKGVRSLPLRPVLGADASALIDQRILPASWYPLEPFRELLWVLVRLRFGGSDEGAVEIGREGARATLSGEQAAYVAHHDPTRTLQAFERIWRAHYDFGRVETALADGGSRFALHGYPDMPRWHGLVIIGWLLGALEMSGAVRASFQLASGPWIDPDRPLSVVLSWG